MSKQSAWIVFIDDREVGPYRSAELRSLVAEGLVVPDTPIRREHEERWRRARQIEGLFSAPVAPVVKPTAVTPLPGAVPRSTNPPAADATTVATVTATTAVDGMFPAEVVVPSGHGDESGSTARALPITRDRRTTRGWSFLVLCGAGCGVVAGALLAWLLLESTTRLNAPELAPTPTAGGPGDADQVLPEAAAAQDPTKNHIADPVAALAPAKPQPGPDEQPQSPPVTDASQPASFEARRSAPPMALEVPVLADGDDEREAGVAEESAEQPVVAPLPPPEPEPAEIQEAGPEQPQQEDDVPAQARAVPYPIHHATALELEILGGLLRSAYWHFRVFGLLRLERYRDAATRVAPFLQDGDWQVRCIAIRQAVRLGCRIPKDTFIGEEHPHVLRAALLLGVPVPDRTVLKVVRSLSRGPMDERLFAIRLASASSNKDARRKALDVAAEVIRRLDRHSAQRYGERLAQALGLTVNPGGPSAGAVADPVKRWNSWFKANRTTYRLPRLAGQSAELRALPRPAIAAFADEGLQSFRDYIDAVRNQDLELGILVDATSSMGGTIAAVQRELDELVLVLDQLSDTLRIGAVAYRDAGDRRRVESIALTDRMPAVRNFLAGLTASGGGDLPESVYHGLLATRSWDWSRHASKQVVIIGDAPDQPHERPALIELVSVLGRSEVVPHLIGINGQPFADLGPVVERWGGRVGQQFREDKLARMILKLSFEPKVAEAFDDFYDILVAWCL